MLVTVLGLLLAVGILMADKNLVLIAGAGAAAYLGASWLWYLFWWLRSTPIEREAAAWDIQIERNRGGDWVANEIRNRMKVCPKNPANGGLGFRDPRPRQFSWSVEESPTAAFYTGKRKSRVAFSSRRAPTSL